MRNLDKNESKRSLGERNNSKKSIGDSDEIFIKTHLRGLYAAATIGTFLCFIPILLNYQFSKATDQLWLYLINPPKIFQYSIVYSMGTLAPIIIRFLLKTFCYMDSSDITSGFTSKAIIVFFMLCAEAIFLSEEVCSDCASLFNTLLHVRDILVIYASSAQMLEFGSPTVISTLIYLSVISGGIAVIFSVFSDYDLPSSEIFFILFIIFIIMSILLMILTVYMWHKSLDHKPVSEMTNIEKRFCVFSGLMCTGLILILLAGAPRYLNASIIVSSYQPTVIILRAIVVVVLVKLDDKTLTNSDTEKSVQEGAMHTQQVYVRLISHELRTPLNSAYMGLDIILSEMVACNCSEDSLEVLDQVRKSCEMSVGILNDLLSADKLGRGIMRLEKTSVPAFSLLLDSISPYFTKAQDAGIILTLVPQRTHMAVELKDVTVHADKAKICQLMKNLVEESIEATPRGGILVVTVSSSVRPVYNKNKKKIINTKRFLKIDISNTGSGICVEDIQHIFSSENAEHHIIGETRGNLWVCKCIVDLHNGEITVTSDGEDCGATFTVYLPIIGGSKETKPKMRRLSGSPTSVKPFSAVSDAPVKDKRLRRKATSPSPLASPASPSSMLSCISPIGGSLRQSILDSGTMSPFGTHQSLAAIMEGHTSRKVAMSERQETREEKSSEHYEEDLERELSSQRFIKVHPLGMDSPVKISFPSSQTSPDNCRPNNSLNKENRPQALSCKRLTDAVSIFYGSHVLVVDDSSVLRKMLSRLIKDRCDTVITADDGVEAVKAYKDSVENGSPISLILMDYQMPNMDGPTAAKTMREMGCTCPIIGVTGNVLPKDMDYFLSQGANKVLFKPIDLNKVDYAVRGLHHL